VESSEGTLEAAEQRAQAAEDEERAKVEGLWERERRCVEAEGEVGGLEADLEAVALRAADAKAALEPRGGPETLTVQQLRALAVGREVTELYTSARSRAPELSSEEEEDRARGERFLLSASLYY
jgi:hypothetical protein